MDGAEFGRYRLVELLGRGGMGEVWRAHDTETDRIVALKVLPTHFSQDAVFQQRFRREAHAAARLNNPHVVPIHYYGEIDGRLFVDMRLVEGRDLQTILADGPLDPGRAVRVIEQIAEALHAAHRIGLVHRDVKPSNVLLDENDFAYLIDFGIARAAGETGLTGTGGVIGSWHYMAPERFGAKDVDQRSDVYSLACVLWECLTGRRPYPGDSLEQQYAGHVAAPPPRPSSIGAPAQFDPVIATGMAKNPQQRYPTTVELARAARDAITTPIPRPEPTVPPEPPARPASAPTAPPTVPAEDQTGTVRGGMPQDRVRAPSSRGPTLGSPAVSAVVPVGKRPCALAVDSAGSAVYVVNDKDGTLTTIDSVTRKVVRTMRVGRDPSGVAFDEVSRNAYVTNRRDHTVSVVDVDRRVVTATIKVGSWYAEGGPEGVAVDPDSRTAYVTDSWDVYVIDTSSHKVAAKINVGTRSRAIAIDPATRTAYVITNDDSTVSMIDLNGRAVTSKFKVGRKFILAHPNGVVVDPGQFVYTATNNGTVCVFDVATRKGTFIKVAETPLIGLALDPGAGTLYVTGYRPFSSKDSNVYLIDIATRSIAATVGAGRSPASVAVDRNTHTAYVANYDDKTVSIITR